MDRTRIMQSERERLAVRLVIVWLLILPLVAFWFSWLKPQSVTGLSVMPILPKMGEPVVATLRLSNPEPRPDGARITLFADGRVVLEGSTRVPGETKKLVQFARTVSAPAGGSYAARVATTLGAVEETHQFPEYSPQVLSSFVSFAASSTTMMTSLINMSYYRSSFAGSSVLDYGLILVVVMLGMTVFVEAMSVNPTKVGKLVWSLGSLAQRMRLVLVSLYVVFSGLALTRLAILFGVVS